LGAVAQATDSLAPSPLVGEGWGGGLTVTKRRSRPIKIVLLTIG
jgi:hypothetical protein